uniref:global nitrogen transcriptional regulator n=1 Tax=Phymatolithon calcareum TaxID=1277942 RepID=UPI0023F3AE64|nr:global nitrogen transcriptional regulator [Phymatolithon calcareum]WEA76797.1 global nitrogen transcriptional regulator [Phymatolithon calcareum]
MIWLEYLENINTSFNIQILKKNDSIIITHILQETQLVIILDGLVQIIKIFTNGEGLCTNLLKANNIIQLNHPKTKHVNYYYKATAITKTAIANIPMQELTKKTSKTQQSIKKFIKLNIYNHASYNIMIHILCHKSTKKRIIQLLLILSKEFGQSQQKHIIIPFYLSHNTISIITGSHRVNITRIMNELKKKK